MTVTQAGAARVMATAREVSLAREVLAELEGPAGALAVQRDGLQTKAVPPEIGKLLQHVLDVMARGGALTISSVPEVLTTSTAASILGISRPTLMKMIREGSIPSHMVGTHHRLRADDVFAALRARRARERAAFGELMELEGDGD